MQASVRRYAGSIVLGLAFVASAYAEAGADSTAPLPFTPPSGWQPLPSSIIPNPLVSWQNGQSSFGVSAIALPVKVASMEPALKASAANMGTLVSSSENPVCGQPAIQLVTKVKTSGALLSQQVQSLDGALYVLTYVRPADAAPDPYITHAVETFCGKSSVAALTAPGGWKSTSARMLGIWLSPSSPSQSMIAISRASNGDLVEAIARQSMSAVSKTPDVTLVSQSSGTLCGKPAAFFTAKTTPNGLDEIELRAAVTQSADDAYLLIYSRPASAAPDPAAVASLSTLCAGGAGSQPSAAPSAPAAGSALPAPSAVPAARASPSTRP